MKGNSLSHFFGPKGPSNSQNCWRPNCTTGDMKYQAGMHCVPVINDSSLNPNSCNKDAYFFFQKSIFASEKHCMPRRAVWTLVIRILQGATLLRELIFPPQIFKQVVNRLNITDTLSYQKFLHTLGVQQVT